MPPPARPPATVLPKRRASTPIRPVLQAVQHGQPQRLGLLVIGGEADHASAPDRHCGSCRRRPPASPPRRRWLWLSASSAVSASASRPFRPLMPASTVIWSSPWRCSIATTAATRWPRRQLAQRGGQLAAHIHAGIVRSSSPPPRSRRHRPWPGTASAPRRPAMRIDGSPILQRRGSRFAHPANPCRSASRSPAAAHASPARSSPSASAPAPPTCRCAGPAVAARYRATSHRDRTDAPPAGPAFPRSCAAWSRGGAMPLYDHAIDAALVDAVPQFVLHRYSSSDNRSGSARPARRRDTCPRSGSCRPSRASATRGGSVRRSRPGTRPWARNRRP